MTESLVSQDMPDLSKLSDPHELLNLTPVEYAHDPVAWASKYFNPPLMKFPSQASTPLDANKRTTINLRPLEAGLPLRSTFGTVREGRAWRSNLFESVKLLSLLACDKSVADFEVARGITVSKLAQEGLQSGLESGMVLATPYMYPNADEKKMSLIASLMILFFLFDDKIELTSDDSLDVFKFNFNLRLKGPAAQDGSGGVLQEYLDSVVSDILEADATAGNGGVEMLRALRGAFVSVHPQSEFQTVGAYMDFWYSNVGADFIHAAAKFSIASHADLNDPRFVRYLRLIGDHYGVVNDLCSFDKEIRALRAGEANEMINVVSVMNSLVSLSSDDSAKFLAYSYQLEIEERIFQELDRVACEESLTDEEWWLLEAIFLTASGNVFFGMTSSRYSGEAELIQQRS